jgi:predicted RNase H-like nuclease (RuvC/YqgF family)
MADNPLSQEVEKQQEKARQQQGAQPKAPEPEPPALGTGDAPSDYAALLRRIRDVDNLKLEIKQMQQQMNVAKQKIAQLEPYVQSLEQAVAERDQQLDELRASSGSRQLMATLKKRDETIAKLQQALQNKHKELEDLRTGRR